MAGASTTALARRYGLLKKGTLVSLIRESGVTVLRRRPRRE